MRYDKSTTQGRWPSILAGLGVDARTLSKRNVPCPFCDGKDRFRFTDQDGAGLWICNQCGNGNGIQFVMRWENCDFKGAVAKVMSELPNSKVAPVVKEKDPREKLNRIWKEAHAIEPCDPVAEYLEGRQIAYWSADIRTHEALPYFEDGAEKAKYPAMVALVRDAAGKPKTLHCTYLHRGMKAPVATPRKVLSKIGEGPHVHVRDGDPTSGVLNIAEGVETALAVHCNLGEHDGHVWSVLSAGAMQQFQPPKWCTRLVIWADNDASFTGQQAAYNLAHRLKRDGLDVRVMVPAIVDHDWADWESWV